jgi:hypothetical protein
MGFISIPYSQAQNKKRNSEFLKPIVIPLEKGSTKYLNAINTAHSMITNLPRSKYIVVDTVTVSTKGAVIDEQVIKVFTQKITDKNKHPVSSSLFFYIFENSEEIPNPVWTEIIQLTFNHNCGEASINYLVSGDNGKTFYPKVYSENKMGNLLVRLPEMIK